MKIFPAAYPDLISFKTIYSFCLNVHQNKITLIAISILTVLAACLGIRYYRACCSQIKVKKDEYSLVPTSVKIDILSEMCDPHSAFCLSQTCKAAANNFQHQKVIAFVIQQLNPDHAQEISVEKKMSLMKKAGGLLKFADLSNSEVTDNQLIEILQACPNITKLHLNGCRQVTSEALSLIPKTLQELSLKECDHFNKKSLKKSLKSLIHLTKLDLSYCFQLTDGVLAGLPPKLQSLSLEGCFEITNHALAHFPTSLCDLNLAYCKNLTDFHLALLLKRLHHLRSLDLTCLFKLTDAALTNLANLKSLSLTGCHLVTDAILDLLPSQLEKLSLKHCSHLTEVGILKYLKKVEKFTKKDVCCPCDFSEAANQDFDKTFKIPCIKHRLAIQMMRNVNTTKEDYIKIIKLFKQISQTLELLVKEGKSF